MAKADAIEHTHIWATTYDSTNHWEYCTVCGEKRNVTVHVFTDHWNNGEESCFWSNYDTKTCECGYSYIYRKPHDPTKLSGWINDKSNHSHHIACTDCGTWIQADSCRDSNGKILGCNNPGTCVTCGAVYTADEHKLTNGKCDYCGKQIAIYSTPEVTYSDDHEYVYIKEKITPVDTDAILQGLWWACSDANGYFVGNYSVVDDADGISKDYSWTYKIMDYQRFSTWSLACTYIINGTSVRNDYPLFNIWYDHEAPVINEIKQTDQASFNGYATIKQLDLTGTDNASKYVDISITDKITGKNMMEKATVNVVNGKWAYTCTPPLEADDNGRIYTLTAIDKIGNSSTQDFTIYKTDGTAPQVESPLSYTNWTNKAKAITLTVSDYGSGNPQASLGDQTHYQACIKVGDKYQITYNFSDDIVGTKNYDLYLKDALGNARKVTLTIGNIDKNIYTITYNLNGGSSSTALKTAYTVEDSFTLPQPTRTGYIFDGWTGSNGTIPQKTVTISKYMRGNLSYTTNWTQINTINYNVETVYPSWAGDKSHIGGTVNITNEVVNGNNVPVGATATAADGFVFDGWYSSTGELITKDATIKPLNCNAEDRGGFIYPSNGGSSVYNASTDTYTITTNVNTGIYKNWGSGVYHISTEIPWNNWYIAEFEAWSPVDAECVIDINNWGPNGHSWNENQNDNDNIGTRFCNQDGNDPVVSLKANTWKKIIIGYQNSNSKNTNHESLWDQHTIAFRYNESLGSQTFKVRNYKAAVSPTLVKELDTFTARFKPWEHTVTYDANGGTGAPESFQKCTWTSRWISSTVPTRTGYTFKNWNTKKDGTGTTFNPEQQYIPDINGGTATLYAQWTPKTYVCYIYGNGGILETIDPPIDKDGHAYFWATYDTPYFYILGVVGKKTGYHMTGVYDHINGGIKVWNAPDVNDKIYHGTACYSVRGTKYYDNNNIWHYDNGVIFYVQYAPNNYIITFNYNKPSTFDDNIQTETVIYDSNIGQLPSPSYTGWTFKGWNTKIDGTGTTVTEDTVYKIAGDSTLYAQWTYNPVSVKIPQILTGDHTGKSQFRVKCDDFKAGSIKISVPNSFLYKQTGKADITAAITSKNDNNTITPTNKVCVYDITTKNGLSAGCWSGNFNIGLTLTKE